jgi:GTP-binding protein HflX
VVDFSSHNAAEQCQVVEDILGDLNLRDKPRVTALNKIDLLLDDNKKWDEEKALEFLSPKTDGESENTVLISATKRWGLKKLLEVMNRVINKTTKPVFEKSA